MSLSSWDLLLLPWPAQTFSCQGASGSLAEAPGRAQSLGFFEASDISAVARALLPRHTSGAAAVQPQSAGGDNRGAPGGLAAADGIAAFRLFLL